MVDRRVRVILEANAGPLAAGFRAAKREVDGFSNSVRTNRAAWDDLSSKAIIGGAAIAGGLGLAAKAAIDWESAWAGVTKTVDGSAAQMAELEGGLRGLAKELPATHEEIAGVAEAAGQLGVARGDILDFTETAIALGESTNLSAEEAATSLAQFSNIMGTVAREGSVGYEKLGSTLVALGNDGASTEKQIMDMALRLAGAGQQIGATEADILAMANALSSVGIEAQLGGGAMSRAMLQMNSAVIGGGEELEKFAQVAGMSAADFAAKWRSDPIAATNEFIGGLGRIGASGGDAAGALEGVGLAGTQNAQVLLRAAGASDLMTDSLKLGASAWKDNAALQEEAQKRYATTESRMKIARNTFKDAAIDLGSVLGPALASVAEKAAGLANAFVQLPGPVKSAITAVAGISSAVLLIGGATIKAIGWMQDFKGSLDAIGLMTPRVERNMNRAGKAAVGFGKALTGLAIAGVGMAALQGDLERIGSQQLVADLNDSGDAIGSIDDAIKKANAGTSDVTSLGKALQVAFDPNWIDKTGGALDGMFSVFGRQKDGEIAQATSRLKELDETLAGLVSSGDTAGAKQMFDGIADAARKQGISVEELRKKFPQYAEALAGAENASGGAAGGMDNVASSAEEAEQATEELTDAITGLGDALLGQRGSARDYQQTLSELKSTIAENGATLDISTQAGRDNEAALDALAESTQDYAAAVFESTGSVEKAEGVLSRGRTQWEKYALAAGMPKDEVKALADELFTLPADVKASVNVEGATQGKARVLDLGTSIKGLDGKTVKIDEDGADVTKTKVVELDGAVLGLPNQKSVKVTEIGSTAAGERVVQYKDKIYAIPKSRTTKVGEIGAKEAQDKVFGLTRSIIGVPNSKNTKISETGATPSAQRITDMGTKIRNLKGKRVSVLEAGATASRDRVVKMDGAIFGLKGKTVSVQEIGSNAAGDRVVRFKDRIYAVPTNRNSNVSAQVHGIWDVERLVGGIGNVQSKTVTITAVMRKIGSWMSSNADGGIHENVGGMMVQSFADGGVRSIGSQQPQIQPAGGKGILWAEQGAGPWESFISGHPAKRDRSRAIWMETGKRLGMVEAHADGAMRTRAPQRHYVAPQPRVTVAAPPVQQPASSGVSVGQMESAIARAFSGVRITTSINGRDFKGVMERTNRDREGR